MKRRVFAAILVVFMVFAFASWRPSYIFVPVERPSTPSSSSSVSTEDVSRALRDSVNEEFFKTDAEKKVEFFATRDDAISRKSLSARTGVAKDIFALVSFIDFNADNGVTFIGGSLLFTIHGEDDGTFNFSKYEAEVVTPLIVDNSDEEVTAVSLKGDIKGSATITDTVVSEVSITSVSKPAADSTVTVGSETVDIADSGFDDGRFSDGSGTASDPFIISSESQFNCIADYSDDMKNGYYLYFEVDSNLDFSSTNNEFIPYFRGEIDFTGKTVSGTSQIRQGSSEWGMIGDFIEGKVMNLVYRPMDYIPIIADVNLSGLGTIGVELINITTYGDITGMGNNDGLFINSAHYGSLKFTDCVNNANLYGSSYCGIFVGGYAESPVTSLEFVNCINNGNLVSKYAGLYYGNSAHVPQNVIITDCVNNGNIIGLAGGGSGLFCGHTSSNTATMNSFEEIAKNGTTGNGTVRTETESMTISYNENGTFTISSVPVETAKIEIVGSIYTRIMVGDTNRGTFMLSVKAIEDWEGAALDIEFPKYGVVDSLFTDFVSEEKDKYENTIVSDSSGEKYYQINALELALPENAICIITNGSEDHKGTLAFTAYAYDVNGVPLAFSNV